MRPSTSRNQANGSIFASSQEVTKLRSTAAVLPPLSLPKNVQLLRPTAKPRSDLSVPLLSIRDRRRRNSASAPSSSSACRRRLSCLAFRQHLLADRQQVLMQLIQHGACLAFPQQPQLFSAQPFSRPIFSTP